MSKSNDFLKINQEAMSILGFWTEEYKSVMIHTIELRYNTDIITEWHISDIVLNGDKMLIKWVKRFRPLTKEELKDKYGR